MCGIVGFTGTAPAVPILLAGLAKLEYRGYDSAGVAVSDAGGITVIKAGGKLANLTALVEKHGGIPSACGLGHTRWATHGAPTDVNAHPHLSSSGRIAVVHNGIIENYQELKERLIAEGFSFVSQTDTEVIANLIDYHYAGDLAGAVAAALSELTGSYAVGVLSVDAPGEIVAARKDSPLVVAMMEGGAAMASDIPALLGYTRDFYSVERGEIAVLTRSGVSFLGPGREPLTKVAFHVDWDAESASKGGADTFMIKEIFEQPRALRDTISTKIKGGEIVFPEFAPSAGEIRAIDRVFVVACGSAAHAGIVGKSAIETLARVPVEVELASEFRYKNPIITDRSLVVAISQSGTTADTREAQSYAKSKGARTLAVINVVGSQIAREADSVIYTNAGPEIAVATTKAYSCQLAVMYMLAVYLGRKLGTIGDEYNRRLIAALTALPDQIETALGTDAFAKELAGRYSAATDVFFIGRGADYAAGLEASLKLKEISYIHSEAYAAGELKHGTLALIERGTPVVAVAVCEKLFDKLMSNIKEVRARFGEVIGVTWRGNRRMDDECAAVFEVPVTEPVFTPSLTIIPLQLFAYYIAAAKGLDIDKPRNLAKSVTVE
ncbi:MAG: glutamine--fructose-6-phosphate transaminase (isomerizing) [Clostridiales bacterium]|jgi:glucosamine--fructose-6-phosphate aminotransferase (isomerizing)|nr:glutamine--fructose-6-phosphate transaminase (isomerizing) [Clostridiales bacterium]